MYGPRNAAGFSVQATRKKSSSERTKFVVISEKFRLYFGRFIFEPFSSHSTGTDSHYQYQVPVPVPGTTS